MDPARMFKESLTSRPELENSLGQTQKFLRANEKSAFSSARHFCCWGLQTCGSADAHMEK
jgi:hypothetical protein